MKQLTHNRFAFLVSGIFLLLSIALVLSHEIWMDEAYHYLLARDSTSVPGLFRNASQSGHPVFWNIVLFYYQKIFPGVLFTQLLHSAIACICVFLISRYSPFNKLEIIFIAFGYFFLYEYNIIAKNYTLGICLIFLALVLYTNKKPVLLMAFVLAVASNVHLFALFVSVPLFIYFILKNKSQEKRSVIVSSCILLGAGIISACVQIIPTTQHISTYKNFDPSAFFSMERIGKTLASMSRALVNIPDFRQYHYWNSNIIFNLNHIGCYLLSALLIVVLFFMFKRDKLILLLFFTPYVFITAFLYMAPISVGVRYWGFFYLMLIICIWLYKAEYDIGPFSKLFFRSVILIQFLISIPVVIIEFKRPFSNAKYAALSLTTARFEKYPLFTQDLGLGPSLSAYTNKKVYYPASKTTESFSYAVNSINFSGRDFVLESIRDLKHLNSDTCVLVMKEPVNQSFLIQNNSYELKKIAAYTGALISSEDYYLYLLHLKKVH